MMMGESSLAGRSRFAGSLLVERLKALMAFSPNLSMDASDVSGDFQTTRGIDPATIRQKMAYDDAGHVTTTPKLVDGRPVYQIPCQYIDEFGVDANVSLSVFNAPASPIPPLARIQLVGAVRPVPWVRNGRIAWSITADSVKVMRIGTMPIGQEDEE